MIGLEQKYLLNFQTVSDILDHPVYTDQKWKRCTYILTQK